jgi:hypothetical protein
VCLVSHLLDSSDIVGSNRQSNVRNGLALRICVQIWCQQAILLLREYPAI